MQQVAITECAFAVIFASSEEDTIENKNKNKKINKEVINKFTTKINLKKKQINIRRKKKHTTRQNNNRNSKKF